MVPIRDDGNSDEENECSYDGSLGGGRHGAKLRNASQMRTPNYFASTAAAISPYKGDGMWGGPCLWDKEKEKGSKGGNDGMRAC